MELAAARWSHITDRPMTRAESAQYTVGVAAYVHGIKPEPRPHLPGYDSGILTIFILALLALSAVWGSARNRLASLGKDLWSVRRRAQAFDDRTVGEAGGIAALSFLTCVCEGTLAFVWLRHMGATSSWSFPGGEFAMMPMAVGAAILFFLFEVATYDITAFTFTDKAGRLLWLRGFYATQSILGVGLVLPALAGLFYPAISVEMCVIGVAMYFVARLIFIIKGFRIFHDGLSSVFYFILYLCTLEIAPLALMIRLGGFPE